MWFEIDVSGLPIGPIFKGQVVQQEGVALRFQTTLRRVTTQKTGEFGNDTKNQNFVLEGIKFR
jgi:hypothetical protein